MLLNMNYNLSQIQVITNPLTLMCSKQNTKVRKLFEDACCTVGKYYFRTLNVESNWLCTIEYNVFICHLYMYSTTKFCSDITGEVRVQQQVQVQADQLKSFA